MNGRYLLDTNIVIALLAGDSIIDARLRISELVCISSIVFGELFFGAWKSSKREANVTRVEAFAAETPVLPCTAETARRYGELKTMLRSKGRPLPENDVWVAATALEHRLVLVTRDRHFDHVQNLDLTVW